MFIDFKSALKLLGCAKGKVLYQVNNPIHGLALKWEHIWWGRDAGTKLYKNFRKTKLPLTLKATLYFIVINNHINFILRLAVFFLRLSAITE